MARWRPREPEGIPEELARFVAGEWPGCWHDAVRAWARACLAWLDADRARELPFGEHGDVIDVLNEWGRLEKAVPPCAKEFRPAQHWLNGPP